MACGLRRTQLDNQKVSELGKANRSKNSLQLNDSRRSLEDSGISSFSLGNIDQRCRKQRCAILTFPTLESDGQWRIVAVPLQYFVDTNHFGSGNQVNINGLHLVSSPSINSFKIDGGRTQKGPQPAIPFSPKPVRARSFPGSNVQHPLRDRTVANKITKSNEVSNDSSCRSFIACDNSSSVVSKGSNATNPSAMYINCPEEDKSTKRNSQKKTRKKRKNKKKQLCDVGSTESEVCSENTRGSSASEICANDDVNCGIAVSHADSPEVSQPGGLFSVTDFADSSNGVVTSFISPNICTSDIDEVDISESTVAAQVHKFPRGRHTNNSEIGSEEQRLSRCQGDIARGHPSYMGSLEGIHPKDLSDTPDSLVLDSVSVGSNSEDSKCAGHIVKPSYDNSNGKDQSELRGLDTKKGSCFQDLLCSISETHDYTDGTKHDMACSSFDGRVVAAGKRTKLFKHIPHSSSSCKLESIGNLRSRTGTENSHSVWKKVQKNAVEKCNTELKKTSSICSQFDITLKDAPLLERHSNATNVTTSSITDEKRKAKSKVPRKLKRKVSPASKPKKGSYSRKESHSNKVNLNADANTSMPKGDIVDALTSQDDRGVIKNLSRSCSEVGCARVETEKSESVNNFQAGPSSIGPCERGCSTAFDLNNLCVEKQDSLLQKSCVLLDQPKVRTPVFLPHLIVNGVARTEKEISLAENGRQSPNLGSVIQKWIPIGTKPRGTLENSNVADAEDCAVKNTFEEKVAPCSLHPLSSVNAGTLRTFGKYSRHAISSPENGNQIKKSRNLNACVNESENMRNGVNFLVDETKEQNVSVVATDLNKIANALNDVYRAQMASEAVQMATGGPIAEFERLLHFSSPVVCHSYSSVGCQTCPLDQVRSALLCRHETPNVPLGCLWQWYEQHGSYGLEIRAEDNRNPKRFGVDQFEFRAYFVPYLSAVQLFRNSESLSSQDKTRNSSAGVSEACDTGITSRNLTNVSHLPIFSVVIPQPRTAEPSCQLQVKNVVRSESSPVSPKDALPVKSADRTWSDHLELVFEYFESEQPQQRRALYEKIQDLVRDDVSPRCKMYGDPAYLNSINILDLHPRSWYSVAWYPIYRIPDGNFRAAFLTYHSLGHLVRRSSKSDDPTVDACIVSPVVGLQSYNAQGECWFQPRHSTRIDTSETQGLSPSGILKERLRTLEETASLMARAVVNKGNETSVNRHPDYEFFLSRKH
ncbi:hypothetical protein DITRI_Ditri20bG0089200 [Diplodiscus trichospermus]